MPISATNLVRVYTGGSWQWRVIRPQKIKAGIGLFDRTGAPDVIGINSSFWPYLDGYVIPSIVGVSGGVSWDELQPTQGGPLATNNAIDQAIAHVQSSNATNGTNWSLILRLMGGIYAPSWAKTLDGAALTNLGGNATMSLVGLTTGGGFITSLTLHSNPGVTSGQQVSFVDVSGNTQTFTSSQTISASSGNVTMTVSGSIPDTYNWATAPPISGIVGAASGLAQGYTGGPYVGTTTIGRWWTANYLTAVKDLYNLIATAYDSSPEIILITDMCCMTTYCEPCLKTGWNDPSDAQQLITSGWTINNELAQQKAMYDYLPTIFTRTPMSKSFNPFNVFSASNDNGYVSNISDVIGPVDDAGGPGLLTYSQVTAPNANTVICPGQIVIENNSLRANGVIYPSGTVVPEYSGDSWTPTYGQYQDSYDDSHTGPYSEMYMACIGYGKGNARASLGSFPASGYRYARTPIHIQTSSASTMGGIANLPQTLAYAAWLGASSVELPNGYAGAGGLSVSGGSLSQMAFYRNAIKANT